MVDREEKQVDTRCHIISRSVSSVISALAVGILPGLHLHAVLSGIIDKILEPIMGLL